jgi:5'-3' exonuclease
MSYGASAADLLFAPDPTKPIIKEDQTPYDLMLIDGGGMAVMAWASHRELERPADRVRMATAVFMTTMASLCRLLKVGAKVVVVWDGVDNRAFRRGRHPWYKHGRGSIIKRGEIREVMKQIEPLLAAMGVGITTKAYHEADDVVATLAAKCEQAKKRVIIFSDDKDFYQLVSSYIHIARRSQNGIIITPGMALSAGMSVGIPYLHEKAIMGDGGDNIKPLKGIGEKKAKDLLKSVPDMVKRCAAGDRDPDAWDNVDAKLVRPFLRAARKIMYPLPPTAFAVNFAKARGIEMCDPELEEDDILIEVMERIAWSFDLVEMDRALDVPKLEWPECNLTRIPRELQRMGLQHEHDIIPALMSIAGVTLPDHEVPWRAEVRAGHAVKHDDGPTPEGMF